MLNDKWFGTLKGLKRMTKNEKLHEHLLSSDNTISLSQARKLHEKRMAKAIETFK